MISIGRARKIARALNLALFAAGGWAFLYPHPYTVGFAVVAALPWVAIWLCWKYKGSFSLSEGANSARPDLSGVLVVPGACLAVRALLDVHLLNPTKLVLPTIIGLALMVACTVSVDPNSRKRFELITLSLTLFAYPAGTLAIANMLLDQREAQTYRLEVLKKQTSTGKSRIRYFTVSGWGPRGGINEVHVAGRLYHETSAGQTICLRLHPGAFGLEWYVVQSLDAC